MGGKMNRKRIAAQLKSNNRHATYIMTATFRILDNHSLYYLMNNYATYHVVIFRPLKNNPRHDILFNEISESLFLSLSKVLNVVQTTSLEDTLNEIKGDIVLDKGYLNEEKEIEKLFISDAIKRNAGFTIIESNVAVPVKVASDKEEYSARTIRNKIFKQLYNFIDPVNEDLPLSKIEETCINHCKDFIINILPKYHLRNHPEFDYTSKLSVYLKYGIISPIRIWLLLENNSNENKESFLDELIIRRELAYNFVYYNTKYDHFDHITSLWAYQTMKIHELDIREYLYTIDDYINFRTHDEYFNTAMKEMIYFGRMHGYMRMYWCKKIIEWSPTYIDAYETAKHLNNYYFLDGDTPNGYAGVAWCFGKHDRPWTEREIFGKLRYMNANGLKRKFDIEQYVLKVNKEVIKSDFNDK